MVYVVYISLKMFNKKMINLLFKKKTIYKYITTHENVDY